MGCAALGICTFFWSSAYVLGSGCVLGLGTVVLGCDLLSLCHFMFLSVCPGCFSAITDVCADYLTSFYNRGNTDYVFKHALPVFEGLFPKPHDTTIQHLLFTLTLWHSLAKLYMHTNSTVAQKTVSMFPDLNIIAL